MDCLHICPECRSRKVSETLRTYCASYLRCDECANMWTLRLPGSPPPLPSDMPEDEAPVPRRRRSDALGASHRRV